MTVLLPWGYDHPQGSRDASRAGHRAFDEDRATVVATLARTTRAAGNQARRGLASRDARGSSFAGAGGKFGVAPAFVAGGRCRLACGERGGGGNRGVWAPRLRGLTGLDEAGFIGVDDRFYSVAHA